MPQLAIRKLRGEVANVASCWQIGARQQGGRAARTQSVMLLLGGLLLGGQNVDGTPKAHTHCQHELPTPRHPHANGLRASCAIQSLSERACVTQVACVDARKRTLAATARAPQA